MINLEEYFNFLAPDDIRLKGTRVGIETIFFDYVYRDRTEPRNRAKLFLVDIRISICNDFILFA